MTTEQMTTSHPVGSIQAWKAKAKADGLALSAWVGRQLQAAIGAKDERNPVGRPIGTKGLRKRESAK